MCLALVIALLSVTLVKEISRSRDTYSFEAVAHTTYTRTDRFTGYVLRDEIALTTVNNGPVHYLVDEGQAVRKNTLLAEVFRDDTGTDKRERAAALYAEITALQATLDASETWKNVYLGGYPELMRALSAGAYKNAAASAAQIATALSARESEKTQSAAALQERIALLQAQLDEMVEHTNDPAPLLATADGIFYHTADGYESTFGTKAAADLTPEGLAALLDAAPAPAREVGKLVSCGTWYLAVPTDKAVADTYTVSQNYALQFAQGTLSMTLDRIALNTGGEQALLIFRADTLPAWLSPSRAQSVSVAREVLTGLSIPKSALVGENTVFVERDGEAQLCYVTPLQAKDGCVLVLAEKADGSLREGDRVIVSTRQLFEGKVLK